MTLSIAAIAGLTSAIASGGSDSAIYNLAKIENAKSGDLTFLASTSYEKYFPGTHATAIFVKPGFKKTRDDIIYLEVDDPYKAFLTVLITHFSPKFELNGIDPSASIDPTVQLGSGVAIGKNVVIEAGCKIGDNTKIFHNTVVSKNCSIGNDGLIFQNVSVREETVIGDRVIIHPGVVLGSDGFGFVPDGKGGYIKIPQIGNVVIGDDVEIGANTAIDRAALGSTVVKKGTKLDNLVQIAHNVTIGSDSVMSAQSGIAGSSTLGNNCIVAGQVGISGHLDITDGVILGAQSGVSKSITKGGMYFGYPAKEHRTALRLEAHIRNFPEYAERIKELEKKIKSLEEKLKND